MIITKLELFGFRNLQDIDFIPGNEVNVICGENAQGKTNLLEAIWLFSGLRSFRGAKDCDYICFDKENARLNINFISGKREQSAAISLGLKQKKFFVNDITLNKMGEMASSFKAVVFSPDHLELVKSGPKNRRKLLDLALCQAYPKYGNVLLNYERILKQRGFLLEQVRTRAGAFDLLEAFDENLARYGGYITWMRGRYVEKLSVLAKKSYSGISSEREELVLSYVSGLGETDGLNKREEFENIMREFVKKNRGQDVKLGKTSAGPHRDDIDIKINGISARSFGSQGQQRSCVLALKLAECKILEDGAGEPPVILLDDVMSELDQNRRGYLLNNLKGRQVFITCCDLGAVAEFKNGKIFWMKEGKLDVSAPGQ